MRCFTYSMVASTYLLTRLVFFCVSFLQVKIKDEIALYLSASERLKQAEQMFADLAAREKKKIAERLSDAAAAAKADATEEEETKTEETSS